MTNPLLAVTTQDGESELKDYIVEYVGTKLDREEVTVEMISEILAVEFPDFLYAYAEENFIRGYRLGLNDASRMAGLENEDGEKENDWTTTSQGELHDGSTE
tara:strand:- start:1231 stop:1536 length:306 start_codon:yes stop_codon:yes gene_type:complete